MKWDDLRVFAAVWTSRSVKEAARELGVTQSTASRRLAALEEALGLPLFHRAPEGLEPTEFAADVAPLAERVAELVVEIENVASDARGSMAGEVSIAASPILANDFLLPRLQMLREHFPDVEFNTSASIGRVDISRREADIALRTHPAGTDPGGNMDLAQKVGEFGFAAYASPAYLDAHGEPERPIRGLAGHFIVVASPKAPGARWNDSLEPPAKVALTAYPYASTLAAAVNGIGLAVLPCLMADKAPGLVRVSGSLVRWNLWIVSSAHRNPRIARVREVLVELVREAAQELTGTAAELAD
ncbi:MAG: LysR family transcriptional regulator [Deltaproteobacteria bacterium]|nr:LysR family transcriptional regulator [Deltaproteobacteria bacterium]